MPNESKDQPAPASLSVCIIAHDEAHNLPDCLAGVAFSDEIVLVDSGSSDGSVEIARAHGANVHHQPWLGFAAQRNVALDHASCDWVLEIDADERVTPELRREIEDFLAAPPAGIDIAGVPRREVLVGHVLGPSAKYPKYGHRLVRRGSYRHDEDRTVHEGFAPVGEVYPFDGALVHLLALTWREAVSDAWRYARLEAGQMQGGRSPAQCLAGVFLRPSAKLAYRLLIDGGWRDGLPGLARILLDCCTDSVVWVRHMLDRAGSERGRSGVGDGAHYGSRRFRVGSLRLVGVAADEASAAAAGRWLDAARGHGADVALVVVGGAAQDGPVRVRRAPGSGPLALIRALDAEEQLRPIDAVIPFGRRARLLARALPSGLRGERPHVRQETDPRAENWSVREQHDPDPR